MNVRPNETQVRATVRRVTPCPDGQGFDVDLEIGENQSPDPASDFLKPHPGDRLQVYSAGLEELSEGKHIVATLALLGGPFQQRTILRTSESVRP